MRASFAITTGVANNKDIYAMATCTICELTQSKTLIPNIYQRPRLRIFTSLALPTVVASKIMVNAAKYLLTH